MNLLIQWITWNYALRHCWHGEKLLRQLPGKKQGVSEKAVEKSRHRH